MEESTARNREH